MDRRTLITGASVLLAVTLPVMAAPQPGPGAMVTAVAEWQRIYDAFEAAPDPEGNWETPEHERLNAEKWRLVGIIKETPVQSHADAAALLRFVSIDNCTHGDPWPSVQGWALEKLVAWSERVTA